MSPFTPIGEHARWRTIYNLISQTPTGSVITYEQIAVPLNLDPAAARHPIQMACRRAAKESEEAGGRALEAVRGVGYRIVEPEEHLRLAQIHQSKSSRSLVRGKSKVEHVDLSGMEPEVRKTFEVVARAFSVQMELARRLDMRQSKLESALESVQHSTERSAEEIAVLRARLDRLEAQ